MSVVGGWTWCTIRPLPSARARRLTRTPRSLRPSSRSFGRTATRSLQLPSAPQLTPQVAPLLAPSSYILICLLTCPARMHAYAFQYNAASHVPTPTTETTCQNICQRGCPNVCSTTSPRIPPLATSLRTLFGLLSNDSIWRRSPYTDRAAVKVGYSRWCTRRIGRDSLGHPGI